MVLFLNEKLYRNWVDLFSVFFFGGGGGGSQSHFANVPEPSGQLPTHSLPIIKATRAEVSTLKNAKLCKIGVECVEFM